VLRAILDRFRQGRTSGGDHRQVTRRQLRARRREVERQIDEIARAAEAAILREALRRAYSRHSGDLDVPRIIDGEWR
jgi:hypothetical protein